MKINHWLIGLAFVSVTSFAQTQPANYEEDKVPDYTLPALLTSEDGKKIKTVEEWEQIRRPEILSMFTHQMYGVTPNASFDTNYRIVEKSKVALDGKATRQQVELIFSRNGVERKVLMLMYVPNAVKGKVPVFFAYNFWGNQVICKDEAIIPTSERAHGSRTNRWPVSKIIEAGYAVATIDYNQVYLDEKKGGRESSVWALFDDPRQKALAGDDSQALGAWAWGMSRAMDYFEHDKRIDDKRVVLMGHSRQGKAALWTGAQDKRFAIVISNCSGCGGAALSKREFGENVSIITNAFPHWFCKNFNQYAYKEETLPFDQHELIALIAPRPVYVVSAEEDKWADPKGEFLSAFYAGKVYALYGYKGLGTVWRPKINEAIMNRVGYHIRSGVHDVTEQDWDNYIRFANLWLEKD